MNTSTISLPGLHTPAAGFEQPFEMLAACHERVQRMLALLERLRQHLLRQGCDASASQAARDVMRYFDMAAPLHHQDEELHVFPPLLAMADEPLRAVVTSLQHDHREMEMLWARIRCTLQTVADCAAAAWQPMDAQQEAELQEFAALYQQHLQHEDAIAYPAARAQLTNGQLQAMSADMMRRRTIA